LGALILVIDNYDSFTWNLVHRLAEAEPSLREGDIRVIRNDELRPPDIEALGGGAGPSHIVISPGPCTPREAGASVDMVRAFAGRVPILGVCLGHQCIAEAFGMRVERHACIVHGKPWTVHHDGRGVFAGLPDGITAARYHSLIVREGDIGREWEVSAWAEDGGGRVVMGMRLRGAGAPLEGVQFHPESFMTPDGVRMLRTFLAMAPMPR
jgi:anthranilate synthase/aminodeoxychorismate synthase-like glutamine amidotransferase